MVELRTCRDDDEKLVSLAIYNEVWPHEAVGLEVVREWERRARASTDLLAYVGGEPVGSGAAAIMRTAPHLVTLLVTVRDASRRRGVGSALYEALSQWARGEGVAEAEARACDLDPDSIEFAQRRGFRVHSIEPGVALDLGRVEPAPVAPPPGIEIVPFREELARGIYDVGLEADPDVPGYEDWVAEPFEEWRAAWRPEQTFVALHDDEVVGYARLNLDGTRPGVAGHQMTGVKRAFRGRGVAGALKRAQITWAKRAGLERLETSNEIRNEPIRRLNAKLGYVEAPGRVWLRGPLAPADRS